MSYTITVSDKQAAVISAAVELYARVNMGQLDAISTATAGQKTVGDIHELRMKLAEAEPLITGLPRNRYWGIFNSSICESAKIAWDLYQAIRHRMSWDREPNGEQDVSFREPMRASEKEPLAVIAKQ